MQITGTDGVSCTLTLVDGTLYAEKCGVKFEVASGVTGFQKGANNEIILLGNQTIAWVAWVVFARLPYDKIYCGFNPEWEQSYCRTMGKGGVCDAGQCPFCDADREEAEHRYWPY